jgi:hypothetical protein
MRGDVSLELKWPGREIDHSPLSSAEIKNTWRYTSTPTYVFIEKCHTWANIGFLSECQKGNKGKQWIDRKNKGGKIYKCSRERVGTDTRRVLTGAERKRQVM